MSLTARVSLFFLSALGLVLVGFSVTLYSLAHHHLHHQIDDRLDAAMQTLVAAVEVHSGDVEWEPLERRISLGHDPGPDQLRWTVHDLDGRLLDCSANLEQSTVETEPVTASTWRILTRRVRAGTFDTELLGNESTPRSGPMLRDFPDGETPGITRLPRDRYYRGDGLVLTVAVADDVFADGLRFLALAMTGISCVIWLMAAFWGRSLCRRALSPITRMASSARSIRRTSTDDSLLDVSPSRDELEDLGRAFNELLADLRLSLERQNRFTGDASHQLRTPLTAMLTSVEVALRQARSPAEYQRVLAVVRRRAMQLRQIIESLLFLARAESDSQLPEVEEFDLCEWCQSWLESWADQPRHHDLVVQTKEEVISVRANPALLGQVLDNLLDNACKYSEAGTPIVVSVGSVGTEAILNVSDRGCGIAPEERTRIYEPFFRSPQARWAGVQGAGLGLTVARRLVTLLGGRLTVESELGRGSQFRLIMPISTVPSETAEETGNESGEFLTRGADS